MLRAVIIENINDKREGLVKQRTQETDIDEDLVLDVLRVTFQNGITENLQGVLQIQERVQKNRGVIVVSLKVRRDVLVDRVGTQAYVDLRKGDVVTTKAPSGKITIATI